LEVNPSFIKAIASAIILGSEGSGGSGENNKTKNYSAFTTMRIIGEAIGPVLAAMFMQLLSKS
jgi:hypothetical protein